MRGAEQDLLIIRVCDKNKSKERSTKKPGDNIISI